ncbi:hypothetical protein D2930_03435 [Vibrio cholerae]|nr:hypothetical protein D2930_03435 [Vibrio cholerae]
MQKHKFGAADRIVSRSTDLNTNIRGKELESLIVDTGVIAVLLTKMIVIILCGKSHRKVRHNKPI